MDSPARAMHAACVEARKWLGATSPNPPVGAAALDKNGNILALAAHERAGGAHAEAALLETCRAQNLPVHTLCVTLEPCNHHGRTPPCTEAIIAAGIKRVVIGTRDPNPVAGGGIERLRAAGIETITGVEEEECRQLIHAFAFSVKTGLPWITVKRALDRNGSMIPPPGQKTFTAPESLKLAHLLRKKADAILTGSGTILADDPAFTVRHIPDYPGRRRHLAIISPRGRVPESYIHAANARGLDAGVYPDAEQALADLGRKNARDVLVEAGPSLSRALLDSGLWTMSVTIHQCAPDRIEVDFNPARPISFDANKFRWDYFLPE